MQCEYIAEDLRGQVEARVGGCLGQRALQAAEAACEQGLGTSKEQTEAHRGLEWQEVRSNHRGFYKPL